MKLTVFSLGFLFIVTLTTTSWAGPTVSAGYVTKSVSQQRCAEVTTQIINETYLDFDVTRTEAGNVLATSSEFTVLVLCVQDRISVSVAGYGSRTATHAISEDIRHKLVQRL